MKGIDSTNAPPRPNAHPLPIPKLEITWMLTILTMKHHHSIYHLYSIDQLNFSNA